uniref:non-specific serine/threonine protein kinase n=1 Tax=Moschus moschiferus TaxID=68415 RepID=A0A8C6EG56_MOSMO
MVLELAARGDLLEHINTVSAHRHCPGLEEEEARRLLWQLVSAVAHCHNSGIVHRDLKCENILLDDRGCLKLSDFGFANRSGLKNSLLSTFCGSVAYTAPEILMSKKYNGEQGCARELAWACSRWPPTTGCCLPHMRPSAARSALYQVWQAYLGGQMGGSSAPLLTLPL